MSDEQEGFVPSVGTFLEPKVPGHNVDAIHVGAGLAELERCGYTAERDGAEAHMRRRMVVEYALQRWARGEEEQGQRGVLTFGPYGTADGIDLTSWLRVLAAARATAERDLKPCVHEVPGPKGAS